MLHQTEATATTTDEAPTLFISQFFSVLLVLPSAVGGLALSWSLVNLFFGWFRIEPPLWVFPFSWAAAWMICGILVAPSERLRVSVVLYLIGAAIAWSLEGGLIVWPYNGWPELAAAFIGGGLGILVSAMISVRASFLPSVVVSAGLVATSNIFVVGSSYIHLVKTGHAWGEPGTLFTRNAEGKERTTEVRYARDGEPSSSAIWIWTHDTNSTWYAELFQQGDASFMRHSGSGGTGVRATRFDDADTHKRVEALLANSLQKRPRTLIPLPKVDLSSRVLIRLDERP